MRMKYLLSTKGSALISILTAVTLLGVSGVGLFQYMSNFQQTASGTIEKVAEDQILKNLVIAQMRSLLIEKNIDAQNRVSQNNVYGVCSFVKQPSQSHGIQKLKVSFPNLSSNSSFSLARWQVFFPKTEWKHAQASHCQKIDPSFSDGPFSRCFEYIGTAGSESGVNRKTYIIAKIVLRQFPDLSPITNLSDSFDPKEVVFNLQTVVATYGTDDVICVDDPDTPDNECDDPNREERVTYMSYQSDVVWTNDVGECHVQASDGKWTVVRMSATSIGSSLDTMVYNSLFYSSDTATCEQRVGMSNINNDVVQAGQNSNLRLSSIIALNARLSCTKNKFSCKQRITTESLVADTYDEMVFSFNVFNKDISDIKIEEFNITLKNHDGTELDATDNKKLDSVDVSYTSEKGNTISGNEPITYQMSMGSHLMNTTISNSSGTTQLSSYCHNICQNYNPTDSDSYVYPVVTIEEKKVTIGGVQTGCSFTKDYSDNVNSRVHCTVCHTKACHRYGLGTFGPLHTETRTISSPGLPDEQRNIYGLSDEPLDGQIPECVAENSYTSSRKLPGNVQGSGSNAVSSSDCKAMAMGISDESSFKQLKNNTYTVENCNTQLPVLCFINGQYLPAMKINTSNLNAPNEVVTAGFEDAEKVCFETGKEIAKYYDLGILLLQSYITTHADLVNRVTNALKVLPKLDGTTLTSFNLNTESDTRYNFINNAVRGIFLAPSHYNVSQLSEKSKNIISTVVSSYDKVWTAMEWDAEGLVVASPPWALVAKNDPYAIFYDKSESTNHRPVVLQDTKTYSASSKYFVLTHNIHWKGLVPENENNSHKFVCKKTGSGEFFVTNASSSLSNGPVQCKAEGGIFVPPETGLDWAKAMLALNPNDPEYPFPDPNISDSNIPSNNLVHRKNVDSGNSKAWVALEKTSSQAVQVQGPRAKDLRLYKGNFPSGSLFSSYSPDSSKSDRAKAVEAIQTFFNNNDSDDIIGITGSGKLEVFVQDLNDITSLGLSGVSSSMRASANYRKVCLKSDGNEYKPSRLVNVGGNCPSGETVLEINSASESNNLLFKPTSYKYLSYWLKHIGANEKVVLNNSNAASMINTYNNQIDNILQCGQDCSDDYNSCESSCSDQPCRDACDSDRSSCESGC